MRTRESYAGKVAIDPAELRTVASRYTSAAGQLESLGRQVKGNSIPELPPELEGKVAPTLRSVGADVADAASPLTSDAKELRVRALWAEISANGGTVSGLGDARIREFVALMKSGQMLAYASRQQRKIAGAIVAELYKRNYKEPAKLIELAAIMKANSRNPEFAGMFVERFGAKRYADIPRVIQAMQWAVAIHNETGGGLTDPKLDKELARKFFLDGYRFEGDGADLLEGFMLALATATSQPPDRRILSRQTARELAHDEDSWAVAQLLHHGKFGKEFLRDVFHSGVIAELGREGGKLNWGHQELTRYQIGDLSDDQKKVILDAIERNRDAVPYVLSQPVPAQFQYGVLQGEKDPFTILYEHMPPDDAWERQFARMYETSIEHGDNAEADQIRLSLVDRVVASHRDIAPLTVALGRDLGEHHMEGLHLSAGAHDVVDPTREGVGWYDGEGRLALTTLQLAELVHEVGEVDGANEAFLDGAVRHQTELIDRMARGHNDGQWAHNIGAFNGTVVAVAEQANGGEFDASNKQQRLALSFVNSTAGAAAAAVHPAAGVAAAVGGEGLNMLTQEQASELVRKNGTLEATSMNTTKAAIAAGYHAHDPIRGMPDSAFEVRDGTRTLIPYDELDDQATSDFNRWLSDMTESGYGAGAERGPGAAFLHEDRGRAAVMEILVR